jgi:hypothetical protein
MEPCHHPLYRHKQGFSIADCLQYTRFPVTPFSEIQPYRIIETLDARATQSHIAEGCRKAVMYTSRPPRPD